MENQQKPTNKIALNYGLILGFAGILQGLVFYAMGKTYDNDWYKSVISIVIMAVIIFLGIKEYRKNNSGLLSLGQGIKTGLGIVLIGTVISVIYTLIFANFIEPGFIDNVVELQEKQARVEDAICATKAAIKQGIVPGGGIALLNAANDIETSSKSEEALLEAIKAPFKTILHNAGIEQYEMPSVSGDGINVVTGNMVNMIEFGIIDPLLVTKSALNNAASVATTILSTDCVINNLRIDEGNR